MTTQPPPTPAPSEPPASPPWWQLGPIGGLALAAMLLPPIGGFTILGTMHVVGPWLAEQHALGVAIYVVAFILLAAFALLPTYAQAALGGWAFGVAIGLPAAMLGFIGAALLGHALAGRLSTSQLPRILERRPRMKAVHAALLACGFWRTVWIVALVRLPPNSPFAAMNIVFAGAGVGRGPFILGTVLGMFPRTIVAVYAAAGLSQLDLHRGPDNWMIVAGIVLTFTVIIVLGLIAKRALAHITTLQGSAA